MINLSEVPKGTSVSWKDPTKIPVATTLDFVRACVSLTLFSS